MTIQSALTYVFNCASTLIMVTFIVKVTVLFSSARQMNDINCKMNKLQKTIESLKSDMSEQRRIIDQQVTYTMTLQQQILETSENVSEVFDNLDLLDNRLLDIMEKTDKKHRRMRQDQQYESVTDIRYQQNENTFDRFIADCLVSCEGGKVSVGQIESMFRHWFETAVGPRSAGPTDSELKAYMSRTFHWTSKKDDSLTTVGVWTGITAK